MYQVEVTNKGNGEFTAHAGESVINIYTTGKPFSPMHTLIASLGACVGFFTRTYLDQAKLGVKEFSVRVESEFSQEEKPMAFRRIAVSIDLKGAALDDRRKQALLAFVANCPVKATLAAHPAVDIGIA